MEKIFIVSNNYNLDNAYLIANKLSQVFDLNIATTYISSREKINSNCITTQKYYKELDNQVFYVAYKNNAMLYSLVNDDCNIGITMEDYYNNDIFCLTIGGLDNIAESRLTNALIIWIDMPSPSISKSDICDINTMLEIVENTPYLYFYEDVDTVVSIVCQYLNGDFETKQRLLEENS